MCGSCQQRHELLEYTAISMCCGIRSSAQSPLCSGTWTVSSTRMSRVVLGTCFIHQSILSDYVALKSTLASCHRDIFVTIGADKCCVKRFEDCCKQLNINIDKNLKRSGELDCLIYAHENGCRWDERTCTAAARNQHLKCLTYLHENGCPWNYETLLISNGPCRHYAMDNNCPKFS